VTSNHLRHELERFDPELPIEDAWTPPASWYTSQAVWELERRSVFARAWQPIARVDELESGTYASGCFAGTPFVVTRERAGMVRALHNTCRHKGREVVVGRGRADELVCGYHGWSYRLDGALASAPRMAGVRGFERDALALPRMGVEELGPWIWVAPDPAAPSLLRRVAPLVERLESGGWQALRFASRKSWTIDCNWKVYVDNYLDGGYHIPHMHPSLDAQIDMSSYRTDLFDEFSIQTAEPRAERDARIDYDARERIGPGAIYAWIHPNVMLNRYGPCLDLNHVVPLGPHRCRVDYEFWFEPQATGSAAFVEESIAQADVTQREDIAICESVQRGLRSGSYDRGRYAPRVEHGELHFHRLLARDLKAALEA
jgi:choline monooxygenase